MYRMGFRESDKGWKKGPWNREEDKLLTEHVSLHGEGSWSSVSKFAGLNRSGKSCRLRWVNYLKPGLKKGQVTAQEEAIIFELHAVLGNKWSTIAKYLPGRTDNEIKNYWRTHFKKKDNKSSHEKLIKKQRANMLMNEMKIKQQLQQPHQEYNHMKITPSCHADAETTTNEPKLVLTQTPRSNKNQENPTMEDQYYMPLMFQDQCLPCSWTETTVGDVDSLWVSLWDLDEPQLSKYVMLNQEDTFGGVYSSKLDIQSQDRTCHFDDMSNNLVYTKYMHVDLN